uniref:Uncharacterized protein n=1 Tax=Lepeophtheirus salmonis TaxID=72036 RepID=A0A0K2VHZ2_LEPSM
MAQKEMRGWDVSLNLRKTFVLIEFFLVRVILESNTYLYYVIKL